MFGSIVAAMFLTAQPAVTPQARRAQSPRCTFQSLPPSEQERYQSRYNRRVRVDGKAYADAWLQEEACPSPAQQAAEKKRLREAGRPCKRTRSEMRVTPGLRRPHDHDAHHGVRRLTLADMH